jgi:hypothetical protein
VISLFHKLWVALRRPNGPHEADGGAASGNVGNQADPDRSPVGYLRGAILKLSVCRAPGPSQLAEALTGASPGFSRFAPYSLGRRFP